jgi:DNA-directed RNA polymerase specialized sigma24 family protein
MPQQFEETGASAPADTRAAWPERLRRLSADIRNPDVRFSAPGDTDRAASALWILIQTALGGYLAFEIRNSEIRRDVLPGLAAEKTAQLVEQIRRGSWKPAEESEMRIRAYIKQVAGNTARAFWKKYYRDRGSEELAESLDNSPQTGRPDPEQQAAGEEAARRLLQWLKTCRIEHALIFVMKAFYQMRTREIADHPGVRTSPTNVDTVWDRMRKQLRSKLTAEEGATPGFPPGTFAAFLALWEADGGEGLFPAARGGEAHG